MIHTYIKLYIHTVEAHYNADFGVHGYDRLINKPRYKRRVLYDNEQEWEPRSNSVISESALYQTAL